MSAGLIRGVLAALLALAWCANQGRAQEFRVYTRILEGGGAKGKAEQVGQSTALFHAGKVYDRVDSGHEMTIFEPAHQRFVLIDSGRRVSTIVTFNDIQSKLYRAEQAGEKKLAELESSADARDLAKAECLRFILHPEFATEFDSPSDVLKMQNPFLEYTVKCAEAPVPDVVKAYLHYADWAAKLNFVVDSKSLPPATRILVNDEIRTRQRLPQTVTLQGRQQLKKLHRIAEHQYRWKLEKGDREAIRYWEDFLSHPTSLRQVPFERYPALFGDETSRASR